ncbi:hypothetical protein CEXT_42871 [Caerostris extrusa]|uniref:Uncharacterized protein n=1 Tax=Caerostris extrusa TaxID=172846 RepID=A0AAV4TYR9_CAEEX|nr:hypothetical protein CEXT_42871 [Caerostris extrusa]
MRYLKEDSFSFVLIRKLFFSNAILVLSAANDVSLVDVIEVDPLFFFPDDFVWIVIRVVSCGFHGTIGYGIRDINDDVTNVFNWINGFSRKMIHRSFHSSSSLDIALPR